MADGSVIITAELDTELFLTQIAALETQVASMAGRMHTGILSAAYTGTESAVSAIVSAMSTAMEAMVIQASGAGSRAAQGAIAGFTAGSWREAGTSASSALTGGISDGISRIRSVMQSAAAQAKNAFTGDWYSVGTALSWGIAAGISASAGAVTAAVETMAEQTMTKIKEIYEIASPSGRMRDEVGIMLSRGIAEGILDGSRFIESSLAQMGQRITLAGSTPAAGNTPGQVIQNIYLRENDTSPYATARAIRRESEAILRA